VKPAVETRRRTKMGKPKKWDEDRDDEDEFRDEEFDE
jgi:hypothetical protein